MFDVVCPLSSVVSTVVGGYVCASGCPVYQDGVGSNVFFLAPNSVAIDVNGSMFVTDGSDGSINSNKVRRISASGGMLK